MRTPGAIRLCSRLAAIAELVPAGRVLADIGTDHALLPAALVLRGVVPRALACDRAAEPLARARATIERLGLEDRIALRLGEGLAALTSGEAETAVIAGVGAATVLQILEEGGADRRGVRRLVLQPNCLPGLPGCGLAGVRRWLVAHGLAIVDERLVEDRGRFYTAIAAEPGGRGDPGWSRAAWAFGPVVLRRGGDVLARCLAAELRRCEAAERRTAGRAALAERRARVAEALAEARGLAHPGPV